MKPDIIFEPHISFIDYLDYPQQENLPVVHPHMSVSKHTNVFFDERRFRKRWRRHTL